MADGERPVPDHLLPVILAGAAVGSAEAAGRLAYWRAATGGLAAPGEAIERRLASDIMALMGAVPAARVLARRGPMLDRAAAAVRAAETPAVAGLRRVAAPGDMVISARRQAFAGFFAVEVYDLTFRRFDGGMSPTLTREVFVGCDAVTVLPYDPVRDRVLVIEQARTSPLARGDANPWQIEAVAGRIDAGETPEGAAHREAREEAGIALRRLEKVAEYYPTTAAFSEYLYSYVGLCDLPDGSAGVHGLAEEAENIRGHLIPAADLFARVTSGEIGNAPLLLTAFWLRQHRRRLRARALRKGF